ncbi:MAG: FGGY-family carbohydrate kinase [Candidatus Hodarchaeota archaeon]
MGKSGDQLIAVIDLGTTGNRSVLFDLQGNEILKAYREFPTITEEPQQAEQEASDWWRTTTETMREVATHQTVTSKEIVAVSVVTQRATLVPLDSQGNPLARAMTWMDGRFSTTEEEREELVKSRLSVRRALWFKDMLPEVFKKTHKLATPDAFLYHRLTGKLVSDQTNHSFGLLDREKLTLSDTLGDDLALPVSLWSDLVMSGTIIGEITKEAAQATCLPQGTPVVVGGGDQQCSVVGLGVIEKGAAKMTTGTGTFIVTPVDGEKRDPFGVLFSHPHVLPNQWVLEGAAPGTGTILRWFRDEFGHVECAVAERLGRDPYDYITAEAAQAPPGCDGLILFPFFIYGLGIIEGLGFQHKRAHFTRSIMEAIAFISRFLLDTMGTVNVTVDELRLDGGGARSALWRQIHSDITQKRCILTGVDEGSALGAAIIATVGLDLYPSIEKAVKAMVHHRQTHTPNPENFDIYNQGYSKFQQILMSKLSELVKHI